MYKRQVLLTGTRAADGRDWMDAARKSMTRQVMHGTGWMQLTVGKKQPARMSIRNPGQVLMRTARMVLESGCAMMPTGI